jgi:hypothetical protein
MSKRDPVLFYFGQFKDNEGAFLFWGLGRTTELLMKMKSLKNPFEPVLH